MLSEKEAELVTDEEDWTSAEEEDRRYREPPANHPGTTRSTYVDATHGPEPCPDWVITSDDAWDFELGILKTGKEADVFLVERALGSGAASVLMSAKRYRTGFELSVRHIADYASSRDSGDSRVNRATRKNTPFGRVTAAQQWIAHEFDLLGRLWQQGAPVPYPVQLLGTEMMLEFIGDHAAQEAAPRLAQTALDEDELRSSWTQAADAIIAFASVGVAHADLSAFNILVERSQGQPRLVVIDFPQAVDIVKHPTGVDLLRRDCVNVCNWFRRQGVDEANADDVFAAAMERL